MTEYPATPDRGSGPTLASLSYRPTQPHLDHIRAIRVQQVIAEVVCYHITPDLIGYMTDRIALRDPAEARRVVRAAVEQAEAEIHEAAREISQHIERLRTAS